MLSDERIEDYAFIQKDDRTIHLYVKSDFKESYLLAKKDLIKRLKDYNITDFNIINMDIHKHNDGDKKRRVKNEYTQKN